MKNIKKNRFVARGVKHPLLALLLGMTVVSLALLVARAGGPNSATTIRWDLISFQFPDVFPGGAGGVAEAKAIDGSEITLTGSGTFVTNPGQGQPQTVTGGGEWATATGNGTYSVTGLVRWEEAPGSLPAVIIDHIGALANARAGLVVLTIAYSDGDQGVLTVSCKLPIGTPPSVLEGVTATKGYVYFWDSQQAVNGVDANRTLFHVLP